MKRKKVQMLRHSRTVCQLGGEWSQSYIPACQEVYCGPVPQIDNGFAVEASNVTHRGEARFQCYAGFAFPSGNILETISCLDNGEWSPLPNCQGNMQYINLFKMHIQNDFGGVKY